MPQQVTMYRASDGTLHEEERQALVTDLRLLFAQSGAVNACSAGALVAWIAESPEQVAELVKGLCHG